VDAERQEHKEAMAALEAEHQASVARCEELARALDEAKGRSSPDDIKKLNELNAAATVAFAALENSQVVLFQLDYARNAGWKTAACAVNNARELHFKLVAREAQVAALEQRLMEAAELLETAEANLSIVQEQAAQLASNNKVIEEQLAEVAVQLTSEQRSNAELTELMQDASLALSAISSAAGAQLDKLEGEAQLLFGSLLDGFAAMRAQQIEIKTTNSLGVAAAGFRSDAPTATVPNATKTGKLLASLTAGASAQAVTAALKEAGELAIVSMHHDLTAWALEQDAGTQQACAFMLVLGKEGKQRASAQSRVVKMARCMPALRVSPTFAEAFAVIPACDQGDWRWKAVLSAMHAFLHR
jgi:hypothetical protein